MRARVKIDPKQVIGDIDPMIYGQYLEHVEDCIYPALLDADSPFSDELGLREDVVDIARELEVPLVRWPGGCFADIYNWEDGVGPRSQRPARLNWFWGGMENNHFGTDEFLRWCQAIGAKPYVNVNMGTGNLEQAVRWLDYCNGTMETADVKRRIANGHPEPYNVEYWGLGNETWGPWEPGYTDAKTYAHKLREWAQFFRKISPDVKLLAVGSEGGNDPSWDETVIEIAGEFIDYLTIHMYGHTTHLFDSDDYYATVANAVSFETRLNSFCKVITEARARHGITRPINVSIDEWNIRHLDLPQDAYEPTLKRRSLRTLKDAIFVGGVFHAMHRHSELVKMGCHVFFANGNAVINVYDSGVVPSVFADVFRVYRQLFSGQALRVDSIEVPSVQLPVRQKQLESLMQEVDLVDISAVRQKDGRLNVAIINRHKSEKVDVTIDMPHNYRMVVAKTLYDDDVLAVNTMEEPDRLKFRTAELQKDGVVTVLPHSITIVEYKSES